MRIRRSVRRASFFLGVLLWCGAIFAQAQSAARTDASAGTAETQADTAESAAEDRLATLLAGYLANDLNLQKASINAQGAALSVATAKINNGVAVSLSSGTMTIYTDSDGTSVELRPSVTVGLPQANDTTISVSAPLSIQNSGTSSDSTTVSDDGVTVRNASFSVSTGIITGAALSKKISVLEAERKYLEAQRTVQDTAVSAEKAFYTSLKQLYNYAASVLSKRNDLYDDTIDLSKLRAQGYAVTSSTYRKANLKVQSDERDVREAERLFERETMNFARKCGQRVERQAGNTNFYENARAFLPTAIPEVKALNPRDFDRKQYAATESAEWNRYIANLKREADKDLTLRANLGYTFNNSTAKSDTVDGGLSLDWKGLSASAGVSVPTGTTLIGSSDGESTRNPIYTLSFGFVPNTWRLAKISAEQDELDAQLEEVALKTAAQDYQNDMMDKLTAIDDIRWSKKSYAEEYEMYAQLESDMASLYKQGIVTESEWLDAQVNRDRAQINQLINLIDGIIYNDEMKLLFHTDEGMTPVVTPRTAEKSQEKK